MATGAWRGGGASGSWRELDDADQDEVDPFSAEELARWPEVRFINRFAVVRAYILVSLKGVGALALLWATVVLLGGFVSTLSKKDFWYITSISFLQAAGMFDVVVDNPLFYSGKLFTFLTIDLDSIQLRPTSSRMGTALLHLTIRSLSFVLKALMILIAAPIAVLAVYAPLVCAVMSLVRLRDKDYGSANGDASNPNLKPALDLFYYVCCAQGLIFLLFVFAEKFGFDKLPEITRQKQGFSLEVVSQYITATKLKYANNLRSSDDWNFIAYGTGLLDSDMPEDNASGARVLTMLIEQGMEIRRVLIRSPRPRIQKLIGALVWRSSADREMRWLAARIVEHLARDLNLDQFPGALECISTLLVTPGHYSSGGDEKDLHGALNNKKRGKKSSVNKSLYSDRRSKKQESDASPHPNPGKGFHEEDLIVHGLGTLENLAEDERNCTVITSSKGLLSKIIAPVSSDNLIEGIQLNAAWIKVVDGSLKVLIRLMSCPDQEIHGQIADASNIVRNLKAVLDADMKINSGMIELQTRAIEVFTRLVLHHPATASCPFGGENHPASCTTGTREYLIKKTLPIFLTNQWMEDYLKDAKMKLDKETASQEEETLSRASMWWARIVPSSRGYAIVRRRELQAQAAKTRAEKKMKEAQQSASWHKAKAGEALVAMLSMGVSQNNSEAINSFAVAGCGDVVSRLTEILDSNIKTITCRISETETVDIEIDIGCRISAAVILKHLSNHLNEPALRKVLAQLLPIQVEASSATTRCWERATCWTAANKNDEENPIDQGDQHQQPSAPQGNSRQQQSKERMLQAELLSLVASTCASSNLSFASLLLPQPGDLDDVVVRLKKMVEEHWYATPACLAILKLTCKIVMEFIPTDQNAQVIEKHDIVGSLLIASERMARLESSMLFAGVDRDCYGVPVKPLSSVLAKQVQDLLTSRKNELVMDAPASGGP